jgi:hypothetical protein
MRNDAAPGTNPGAAHSIPLDDPSVYREDRVAISSVFGESTTQWVSIGDVSVVYATIQNPGGSIRYLWNCSGV